MKSAMLYHPHNHVYGHYCLLLRGRHRCPNYGLVLVTVLHVKPFINVTIYVIKEAIVGETALQRL